MTNLTAPALYALACGHECSGPDRCYWCAAPCAKVIPHNDQPPALVARKANPHARCPGNQYQCVGCWLFGRARVTVHWLGGGLADGMSPARLSWWLTPDGAWAVRPEDAAALYEALRRPPLRSCLALLDGEPVNRLQNGLVNDLDVVKAGTPLAFTINGVPHAYTIYELDEVLKGADPAGTEPGVQALLRLFGQPAAEKKKLERGRPAGSLTQPNVTKNVLAAASGASGLVTAMI